MQSLQAPTDIVVSDSDGLTRYAVKRTRRQIVSFLLLLFPILLSCYTITLNLDLDETGQGVAWLYFEYYVGDDQEVNYDDINASLAQKGWTTQPPSVLGNGRALSSAYRNFSADQPLDDLIRSVPGFENSASTMQLIVEKDEVLEIYQYTFQTKLVMTEHVNNWLALEEASEEGIKTSCTGLPLVGADEDCTIEFTPQEIQQILDETGPITFVLDIDLPGSLETTNGPWTDTQKLIMNWEADSGADPVNLRAVSIQHPDNEPVSPETLERDVGTLVDRFTVELGNGQIVSNPSLMQNYLTALFSPGKANNMTNGTLYACGWWQGKVVDWLDGIRLSSNADERALLAGLDYGPIQAYYGGHQAVVLYPKGTNWQETGIVLDPWPEQIPQNFTMEQWKAKFGIGSTFGASYGIEPGQRDQDYPHLNGGPSHYPDTLTQDARLHFRRVLVNSPVDVLVTRSDGARIGILPDGTIVNEIPGADFIPPLTPRTRSNGILGCRTQTTQCRSQALTTAICMFWWRELGINW